jgi:dolichol-phosphate mannosyltransferase
VTLISILVPVFNEQDNVEPTYAELKRVTAALDGYQFELLFTDNHSGDRTFEILSGIAAQDPAVRVVRFARNFGFQQSVMTGYRLARGAATIQIDADLQDPPALFGAMLEKWREGYDVVVGVRRQRVENPVLAALRKVHYRILRRLGGAHLIVDAGDFRLIDASVIDKLRHVDDAHPYLRGLISSMARRQAGIAYDRAERRANRSKFPLGSLVRLALDGFIAHSSVPLRLAFYVGLSLAAMSALLAFGYLFARLVVGQNWPAGFATTEILLLFGIGLNSMFLGIIGEYVGRIYDQVRRRPTTVVERTLNFSEDIPDIERRSAWRSDLR